jgi:hypothetical protein
LIRQLVSRNECVVCSYIYLKGIDSQYHCDTLIHCILLNKLDDKVKAERNHEMILKHLVEHTGEEHVDGAVRKYL